MNKDIVGYVLWEILKVGSVGTWVKNLHKHRANSISCDNIVFQIQSLSKLILANSALAAHVLIQGVEIRSIWKCLEPCGKGVVRLKFRGKA